MSDDEELAELRGFEEAARAGDDDAVDAMGVLPIVAKEDSPLVRAAMLEEMGPEPEGWQVQAALAEIGGDKDERASLGLGLRKRGVKSAAEAADDAAAASGARSLAARVLEQEQPTAMRGGTVEPEDVWAGAPHDGAFDDQDELVRGEAAFETRTGLDAARGVVEGLRAQAGKQVAGSEGWVAGRRRSQRRQAQRVAARRAALSAEVEERQLEAGARVISQGLDFESPESAVDRSGGASEAQVLRETAELAGRRVGA